MWSIFDEYIAKVDCCINHLHHFCNFETSRLNIGSCVQFGGMSPDTHWIQHEILVQIGIIQYSTRQYWPTMFAFTHQKLPCVSIAVIFGYRIRPPLSMTNIMLSNIGQHSLVAFYSPFFFVLDRGDLFGIHYQPQFCLWGSVHTSHHLQWGSYLVPCAIKRNSSHSTKEGLCCSKYSTSYWSDYQYPAIG